MSEVIEISLFQEALNAVEVLSLDDQVALLNTLSNRLKLRQHQLLVREVREIRQEHQEGKVEFGSINDFLLELDS